MSEVRLGIDVACRADHRASLADERGEFIWSSWKFRTTTADLERLWAKVPTGASVTVILEPTRNAWVPLLGLAPSTRRHGHLGATEQSADLRDYYNKHAKTDRLDSRVLAVCHCCTQRACGVSTTLVRPSRCAVASVTASAWSSAARAAQPSPGRTRRAAGPGWTDSLGSATASKTALVILEKIRRSTGAGTSRAGRWLAVVDPLECRIVA